MDRIADQETGVIMELYVCKNSDETSQILIDPANVLYKFVHSVYSLSSLVPGDQPRL
jgi:hypothetical protein